MLVELSFTVTLQGMRSSSGGGAGVVTCQCLPPVLPLPAQLPQLEVQGADQGCAPFDPVLLGLVRGELHSDHIVGGVACGRQRSWMGEAKEGGWYYSPAPWAAAAVPYK